jgi:hypothetical protein
MPDTADYFDGFLPRIVGTTAACSLTVDVSLLYLDGSSVDSIDIFDNIEHPAGSESDLYVT